MKIVISAEEILEKLKKMVEEDFEVEVEIEGEWNIAGEVTFNILEYKQLTGKYNE